MTDKFMQVTVLKMHSVKYAVIEFEQNGFIQRRYIPRALLSTGARKGPTIIPAGWIKVFGMEYSNVDLPYVLGNKGYDTVQLSKLQDNLRRAGLWHSEDYLKHPNLVTNTLRGARIDNIDPTIVLNAAQER